MDLNKLWGNDEQPKFLQKNFKIGDIAWRSYTSTGVQNLFGNAVNVWKIVQCKILDIGYWSFWEKNSCTRFR